MRGYARSTPVSFANGDCTRFSEEGILKKCVSREGSNNHARRKLLNSNFSQTVCRLELVQVTFLTGGHRKTQERNTAPIQTTRTQKKSFSFLTLKRMPS
eukprot:2914006-Amphidinium_carterae.1